MKPVLERRPNPSAQPPTATRADPTNDTQRTSHLGEQERVRPGLRDHHVAAAAAAAAAGGGEHDGGAISSNTAARLCFSFASWFGLLLPFCFAAEAILGFVVVVVGGGGGGGVGDSHKRNALVGE
jgi:hypothetical protein